MEFGERKEEQEEEEAPQEVRYRTELECVEMNG